jgi:hypothetical protein
VGGRLWLGGSGRLKLDDVIQTYVPFKASFEFETFAALPLLER